MLRSTNVTMILVQDRAATDLQVVTKKMNSLAIALDATAVLSSNVMSHLLTVQATIFLWPQCLTELLSWTQLSY